MTDDASVERLLTQIAAALEHLGFAIAGGRAVVAHGFVNRPTEDLDLFTNGFSNEVEEALHCLATLALERNFSIEVQTISGTGNFARLVIRTAEGLALKVDLAKDFRLNPVIRRPIGLVLHPDDLAATKLSALWLRREVRDAIDIASMVLSGNYSREQLIELLKQFDDGFDESTFRLALVAASQHDSDTFRVYGVGSERAAAIGNFFAEWAEQFEK